MANVKFDKQDAANRLMLQSIAAKQYAYDWYCHADKKGQFVLGITYYYDARKLDGHIRHMATFTTFDAAKQYRKHLRAAVAN